MKSEMRRSHSATNRRLSWCGRVAVLVLVFGVCLPIAWSAEASSTPKAPPVFSEPLAYAPGSVTTEPYRWDHVAGESLALVGPYGEIWRLHFSGRVTKPYFHPLATTDGRTLTWVAPADHIWHYGLWHSWKYIDGVNYWEEDKQTGRSEGATRVVAADVRRADEHGAEVVLLLEYVPPHSATGAVMEDLIRLTITRPAEDGSYTIQWTQRTTALRAPVVLGRTPPPGEPNGSEWGGYAGLSFRASQFLRDVTVTNSRGVKALAGHRQPADWMAMLGRLNGREAAVSIFDHPANPRYPTPWYVVLQPKEPFWFFNAALLNNETLTLEPGRPLTRRYLVRVDSSAPSSAQLEAQAKAFAASGSSTP